MTQFTERYARNDTVHRVPWEGTVLRVVENGTVYKVNLQVFKSGSFPVADSKGSGTTLHWLEDFWKVYHPRQPGSQRTVAVCAETLAGEDEVYEHDANCGKQRVTMSDYVNPL